MKPVTVRQRNTRGPGARRFSRRARPTAPEAWFALFMELLRSFVAREGHARVPPRHREGGFALGRRVHRERHLYRSGALPPERVRRLEQLPGWSWDPRETDFKAGLELLRAFARRHGHVRVPVDYEPGGIKLSKWLVHVRHYFRLGRLSKHRQRALEALPEWSWDAREVPFRRGLRLLRAFFDAHGHLRVPRGRERGLDLQIWMRNQRALYRSGVLSPGQIRALEALPDWTWSRHERDFERGYDAVRRYARVHGHARVPGRSSQGGFPLGRWVSKRRRLYRLGRTSAKRIRMLEAVAGWTWGVKDNDFAAGLRGLRTFARREGHARVPFAHREDGFALGRWVAGRRASYRAGRLADSQVRALERVRGWLWSPMARGFSERVELLRLFIKRRGHSGIPRRLRFRGLPLGDWVCRVRTRYRRRRLSTARRRELETVPGWSWEVR